jgi:hypothetical protein
MVGLKNAVNILVAFSEISRLARNVALGVPQEVFLLFREIPNPTWPPQPLIGQDIV